MNHPAWHTRTAVAGRVIAGFVGGYILSATLAFMLARTLPLAKPEAATAASIIGLLAMPAAIVWAFAADRARYAVGGIVGTIMICALIAWGVGAPR